MTHGDQSGSPFRTEVCERADNNEGIDDLLDDPDCGELDGLFWHYPGPQCNDVDDCPAILLKESLDYPCGLDSDDDGDRKSNER